MPIVDGIIFRQLLSADDVHHWLIFYINKMTFFDMTIYRISNPNKL